MRHLRVRIKSAAPPWTFLTVVLCLLLSAFAFRYLSLLMRDISEMRTAGTMLQEEMAEAHRYIAWSKQEILRPSDFPPALERANVTGHFKAIMEELNNPPGVKAGLVRDALKVKDCADLYGVGQRYYEDDKIRNVTFSVWTGAPETIEELEPSRGCYGSRFTSPPEIVLKRFAWFASTVIEAYARAEIELGSDPQRRYVPALTKAILGTTDTRFEVPWVYMATETGYQVTFPATPTHADREYNTTGRDWFLEMMGDAWPSEGPAMTSAYVDYTPDVGDIVRTLGFKVRLPDEDGLVTTYLLCADLLWARDPAAELTTVPSIGLLSGERIGRAVRGMARSWIGMLIGVGVLLALALVGRVRTVSYSLERKVQLNVTSGDSTYTREVAHGRSEKWGTRIGFLAKWFGASYDAYTNQDETRRSRHEFRVDVAKRPELRGIDVWHLDQRVKTSYWIPFGSISLVAQRCFREVQVEHRPETFASLRVYRRNGSEDHRVDINKSPWYEVRRFVHIEGKRHDFRIGDACGGNRVFSSVLEMPNVREIFERFDGLQQGRLLYTDGLPIVKRLYRDQSVKAVVRDYYLAELLKRGETEVFREGDLVDRVIVVEEEATWADIVRKYRAQLIDLESQHRAQRTTGIRVSLMDELPHELQILRDKDFAVIADRLVVVTEEYYSESRIRGADSNSTDHNSAIRVVGYVSSRDADVRFYAWFFTELLNKSKPLAEYLGTAIGKN